MSVLSGRATIEIIAKISSKNQITLPEEVRRRLGVGPSDSVAFVFAKDGAVELRTPQFDLESIVGSVPPLPGASADFEREIEEAISEEIERLTRRNAIAASGDQIPSIPVKTSPNIAR